MAERRLLTRMLPGQRTPAAVKAPEKAPEKAPDEEDTVRFATRDFRRRRRSGRWRTVRRILVLLLALALIAGAGWVVFFSPYLTADRVEVSGSTITPQARIRKAAQVPPGTPLARVDLDRIRARVESIPSVRAAEISRGWPDQVRIAVEDRVPVGVIDQGNGLRALDREGVLFGGFANQPRRLPLVVAKGGADSEALAEAGQVLDALPPGVGRKVATVEVTSVDDIRLVLRSGLGVRWGSAESSTQKAEVLGAMLRHAARPRTGAVREIDVSVPGRPTTR